MELVESGVLSVATGENGYALFTRNNDHSSGVAAAEKVFCKHAIGDERGITLRFTRPHIVNEIGFALPSNSKESGEGYSSYRVSISIDGDSWKCVANYERYHCHGYQRIQLAQPRAVGMIRIVGTWCSTSKVFSIEEASVR